jgi:hypothetical protein
MMVSAHATPRPDSRPARCPLLNVRCMHNTATGPTVTDDATPTHRPLNNISNTSIIILVRFVATRINSNHKGI